MRALSCNDGDDAEVVTGGRIPVLVRTAMRSAKRIVKLRVVGGASLPIRRFEA